MRHGEATLVPGSQLEAAVIADPTLQVSLESSALPNEQTKKAIRERENAAFVGGMRNPRHAVAQNPHPQRFGRRARKITELFFDENPSVQTALLAAFGIKDPARDVALESSIEPLRAALAREFGCSDTAPTTGLCSSRLRAGLIEACVDAAQDAEIDLAGWIRHGAPIGVTSSIPARGIFPTVPETGRPPEELPEILTDLADFVNYKSVEEDRATAEPEILREVKLGFAELLTLDEVTARYGTSVVASKLALIIKEKRDGSIKLRIVNDFRRSGINQFSKVSERVVLPRMMDLVEDAVALQECVECSPTAAERKSGELELLEFLTIDFSDAFKNIPAAPDERRFQIARCFDDDAGRPRFLVYNSLVFGNGPSPLVWGRAAALAGRLGQSLFRPWELRLQIYIDDPCGPVRGTQRERDRRIACLLGFWAALGFPIAWHKAERGTTTEWIGARFAFSPGKVSVSVPEKTVKERAETLQDCLRKPYVTTKALHSLAGACSWTAGFVPHLRPFVAPLWAACYHARGPRPETVWTKAVSSALLWLAKWHSMASWGSLLHRTYRWADRRRAADHTILVDASPWGLGGVLFFHLRPVAFFHTPLRQEWLDQFELEIGDPAGQAVWELLALLTACRGWLTGIQSGRKATAQVKSDSEAALGAALKLGSKTPAMNRIAREIALDRALGLYDLDLTAHLPGVANLWADSLSRLNQPKGGYCVPRPLVGLPRLEVDLTWKCDW